MAGKRRYKVAEVEAALRAKAGLVSEAAHALGCDRTTVIRYLDRYPRLRAVRAEVRERMNDIAEGQLFKLLNEKHAPTVRWYLGRMATDRGYGQKLAVEGTKDGPPIQVESKATVQFYLPDNGREADPGKS